MDVVEDAVDSGIGPGVGAVDIVVVIVYLQQGPGQVWRHPCF